MSPVSDNNGQSTDAPQTGSVLANLPRTRPQRSSARRAAARSAQANNDSAVGKDAVPAKRSQRRPATVSPTGAEGTTTRPHRPTPKPQATDATEPKPRTRITGKAPRKTSPESEPVPPQGFESDGEGVRGSVHPPGGTELLASAVEIVGELAKTGIASGERLLKDVLSRLSPS